QWQHSLSSSAMPRSKPGPKSLCLILSSGEWCSGSEQRPSLQGAWQGIGRSQCDGIIIGCISLMGKLDPGRWTRLPPITEAVRGGIRSGIG
ncbi:MAG TPA: hypothetical protein VN043_17220, partial [Rhodanobacter sp.]|nr:hypothetical protein [Rhodanobacter sp.]